MPTISQVKSITISDGATASSWLEASPGYYVQSIKIPSTIDGTEFTIEEDWDGEGDGSGIYNTGTVSTDAEQLTIKYGADRTIKFCPQDLFATNRIRFISDVAQAQDVVISVRLETLA